MRFEFIACKYTSFIQYRKMIEYFFVRVKENLAKKISSRIESFLFFKGFSTPKEFLDFYERDLSERHSSLIELRDSLRESKSKLITLDETTIKMSFNSENSDN